MRRRLFYAVLAFLAALALAGMVTAFVLYRDTLRDSQKDNLATMAVSASGNLTDYFDARMDELDVQFSPQMMALAVKACDGNVERAAEELFSSFEEGFEAGSAVVSVELWHPDELTVTQPSHDAFVCGWSYDDGLQGYALVIAKPILLDGALVGYVAHTLDLNAVYREVLGDINVGQRGYCTVKDPDRVVVMHPLASQVGVDTQAERVEGHPEGDWDRLFATQYTDEPGCGIVTSYWWDEPEAGLAKKFIGYAPAYIDGHHFVANVVMAYDELMAPLWQMLVLCTALGVVLLAVFVAGGWRLAKSMQSARHLQRELAYEQELHAQTCRLKLQERQIQQIDRLQTMGVITSSLAHELKNLMTPLSVYIQMLQDPSLTEGERAEMTCELAGLERRAEALLRRILDYVRERPAAAEVAFDASAAVEDALAMVRPLCPRDVRLTTRVLGGTPCEVQGDPGAIAQILLNLATNALYAMREEGGELAVEWGRDPQHADAFVLRVADTGRGMDEDTRLKLFNSFFTTKGEEGTGLGMSVIQGLVQAMRGSIEVASEPGKGSVFTVRLPLVCREEPKGLPGPGLGSCPSSARPS